jgi:hypothetical protein
LAIWISLWLSPTYGHMLAFLKWILTLGKFSWSPVDSDGVQQCLCSWVQPRLQVVELLISIHSLFWTDLHYSQEITVLHTLKSMLCMLTHKENYYRYGSSTPLLKFAS